MVALVTALVFTVLLTLLVIPLAKRRPVGTPLSWGEAVLAATYAYLVMFLAYGVVPHQWLTVAGNEFNWRADRILFGPGSTGWADFVPFTYTFEALKDTVTVVFYVVFLGAQLFLWSWWQKRGTQKAPAIEATSTFGRPLARRG
jgi:hypothetical protein